MIKANKQITKRIQNLFIRHIFTYEVTLQKNGVEENHTLTDTHTHTKSVNMDSSPDLSLKLRRGSNDSRDSYYMDFAQGIDSDIEEVATIASAAPVAPETAASRNVCWPESAMTDSNLPTVPSVEPQQESGIGDDPSHVETTASITIPSATVQAVPAPPLPPNTLALSSEGNNTTTDDEASPTTPMPMPLLPPINIPLIMPKIPLVDEG